MTHHLSNGAILPANVTAGLESCEFCFKLKQNNSVSFLLLGIWLGCKQRENIRKRFPQAVFVVV